MNILTGKTAVITGASRSIGESIALKMAEAGADIAVVYLNSDDDANKVAEKIRTLGVRAECYKCNVADFENVKNTIGDITADFGKIDIQISNTFIFGISRPGAFRKMRRKILTTFGSKYGGLYHIFRRRNKSQIICG